MKLILLCAALILLSGCTLVVVDDFESCIQAGNPALESYPRQCRHDGNLYVEEIDLPTCNNLNEEECKENNDCSPVYGPSQCDGEICTTDYVFQSCESLSGNPGLGNSASCHSSSGTWEEFPNGCADTCPYVRNPAATSCIQAFVYSCDCGPDKCWNGNSCELN